jgi:hypothetical protein
MARKRDDVFIIGAEPLPAEGGEAPETLLEGKPRNAFAPAPPSLETSEREPLRPRRFMRRALVVGPLSAIAAALAVIALISGGGGHGSTSAPPSAAEPLVEAPAPPLGPSPRPHRPRRTPGAASRDRHLRRRSSRRPQRRRHHRRRPAGAEEAQAGAVAQPTALPPSPLLQAPAPPAPPSSAPPAPEPALAPSPPSSGVAASQPRPEFSFER